jgi:hypothetical protein
MAFDKPYWKPNKKQEPFLAVPLSIKEAVYAGGAGSGKTDVLLVYGIIHEWHMNSRFKQVFMRRTFPELRNEVLPRSREIFTKFGATLNRSEMVWTFPRLDQAGGTGMGNMGAMIFLGHCENEDDVHKYDSMEINLFTPDEMTSLTEYMYMYIAFTRVRASDRTLPAIVRGAAMPGGIGHTWFKKRFIDPYKPGGRVIEGKGGNLRIFVRATLADNPHLDPTYGQSLEGLNEAEKKAKKYGDFDAYLGQVFDEFRDKHYPDEPDNALHCIPPFQIPEWWPKFVIGDWGYTAMTYIGYYAVSPTKRLYLYREQWWVKTKIKEWAPYVKEFIEKENPRIVKFCRSAKQDRGQEQTIQEQISEALDVPIELSDNTPGSRLAGKTLLHEYLRWKQQHVPVQEMPKYNDEYARWLLRVKGLDTYKRYLKLFDTPEEEKNIPKLQIFLCEGDHPTNHGHANCCPIMVDSIKACNYDKPKNNKPAEDVAEFEGDDAYDDLRYACATAESYFEEAAEEFKKFQEREHLTQQLANTGDFTAFYRNMRTMEAGDEEMIKPIQRFHRSR